ncbi:hypothetical protein SAMN05443247_09646 [Bradyrhizobium erythrophlei]|jgi:urea transport system substrate-binding protein|nr:hypothetical protein SAMN05443247_09646 [Bradyrhizobium erythrophlei]
MTNRARSNAMFSKLRTGAVIFALALVPVLGAKAQGVHSACVKKTRERHAV